MRKDRLIFFIALAALLLSGCAGRGRIIPRGTLAKIYAEMFVADQWIKDNPKARKTADTTFFYEPIFNSYGYTTKDYIATVDKYVADPEKFAKVFKQAASIIGKQIGEANAYKDLMESIEDINKSISGYVRTDFSCDSLVWADSAIWWHRHLPDSAALDSLRLDSLRLDSLRLDSLRVDSLATINDSIDYVERRDSLRADSLEAAGEFAGHKPAPLQRKAL